jgi:hypothetical protein
MIAQKLMTDSIRPALPKLWLRLLMYGLLPGAAMAEETSVRGSYLLDSKAVGQTPKYLGVCLEVADNAERSNLWDWLADSGAKMVRVVHPDKDMRIQPASESTYKQIANKSDFDAFRARLLADPDKNIPWSNYRFDKEIPWLGITDVEIKKVIQAGVSPIISISYGPHCYPGPLLKEFTDEVQAKDENVNWPAAASAYEYYLANIYRYASRDGVTHFMMLNEPSGGVKYIQQIGVIARMGRLALEDVRGKLSNKSTAAALRLSGPACYGNWEEFWPYMEPYVDFLDSHFYNPDPDMFTRHYNRAAMRAGQTGKKVAFTEYNRIGGGLQPDQALWAMKPALQLGALTMSVLSSGRAKEPGSEMALLYEFQAPATHRNFKSLVYGDMNMIDWTGCDHGLNSEASEWYPTFEELQVRFATPAYHIFKMLSRCAPGARAGVESYEVLGVGESKGFGEVWDKDISNNIYRMTDERKYYALGGAGPEIRVLAVRTPERLIITVLNSAPTPVKRVGFDLDYAKEPYATALVRETSLLRRDQAIAQMAVTGKRVVVDLPADSMTQIILIKDDLTKVTELKFEEKTVTPGTINDLGLYQTTRLCALGKIGERWMDLSELNVAWTSSEERLVNVYQGGLVQRVRETGKPVVITAKTLAGGLQISQTVMPDKEGQKLAPRGSLVPNGGFEEAAGDTKEAVAGWVTGWELGLSPAKGWVAKGGAVPVWERSLERNHTPGGNACLKLTVDPANKRAIPSLAALSESRNGFELYSRQYKVSAWVWRPAQAGLAEGALSLVAKFGTDKNAQPVNVLLKNIADLPVDQWVQIEQTLAVPVDASRMQVQLAFTGEPKQAGALYIDDVHLAGNQRQ